MDDFYAGDVVQQKSGGPKMTIWEKRFLEGGLIVCKCVWFNKNDEIQWLEIPILALQKIVKQEEPTSSVTFM